jgi:hypothetical protein
MYVNDAMPDAVRNRYMPTVIRHIVGTRGELDVQVRRAKMCAIFASNVAAAAAAAAEAAEAAAAAAAEAAAYAAAGAARAARAEGGAYVWADVVEFIARMCEAS